MLYKMACRKNSFESKNIKELFEQIRLSIWELDGMIQPGLRKLKKNCFLTNLLKRLASTKTLRH
jgi:hypothetical protein